MIKIIRSFVHDKRDTMATIVLPILVMVLPYLILLGVSQIFDTHAFFFKFRFYSLFGILFVGSVVRAKIEMAEMSWWIKNKAFNNILNLLLNLLIWPSFLLMLFYCIPAMIVVLVLAKYYGDLKWVTNFIIGVVYFLAVASLFVLGSPVEIRGRFPKGGYIACMNHESFIDYFIWPVIMGLGLSKIIAGSNLEKFPVVGSFIKVRSIMIDRTDEKSATSTLLKVKKILKSGYNLCWGPGAGRDRLSNKGEMKKFLPGIFGILDETITIVPVLVLETMKYKPAIKGEIKWKKLSFFQKIYSFLSFQFWCSPRKITIVIMDGVTRVKTTQDEKEILEDREVFAKRVYDLMSVRKVEELAILEAKRNAA